VNHPTLDMPPARGDHLVTLSNLTLDMPPARGGRMVTLSVC
jgi:hypothetical protein